MDYRKKFSIISNVFFVFLVCNIFSNLPRKSHCTEHNFSKAKYGSFGENKENYFEFFEILNLKKPENFALQGFITLLNLMIQVLVPKNTKFGRQQKSLNTFSTLNSIIKHQQVKNLLEKMKDPMLLEEVFDETDDGKENQCTKLLLCKVTPFVRGMQNSLTFFMERENEKKGHFPESWQKLNDEDRFFYFFPALEDVVAFGNVCDFRFPKCHYNR